MGLTLSQARTRITNHLAFDLDSFQGESPSASDNTDVLNWAMRTVAREIFLVDNNIAFSPTAGVADYNLNDPTLFTGVGSRGVRILEPYFVIVAGNTYLRDPAGNKGLWTMEQIDELVAGWRTVSDGTPLRAAMVGGQYLRLNPAPDAAAIATGGFYIAGQYAPKDMTSGTDDAVTLPIHEDVHEAICYLAAYRHAMPNVSENEGFQRLKAFKGEYFEAIRDIAQQNRNRASYNGSVSDVTAPPKVWL